MRIWHTSLINVLPREQLVAQWRELSSIAGAIKRNGTPNHILVNFVMDYNWDHFISYAYYIRQEMTSRGYRTMNSVWEKIVSLAGDELDYLILPLEEVYKEKMDNTYLLICYHNLLEKALCGGVKKEDWDKIQKVVSEKSIDFLNNKGEE